MFTLPTGGFALYHEKDLYPQQGYVGTAYTDSFTTVKKLIDLQEKGAIELVQNTSMLVSWTDILEEPTLHLSK